MLKNDVRVCVHFCLRPLVPLERCVQYVQTGIISGENAGSSFKNKPNRFLYSLHFYLSFSLPHFYCLSKEYRGRGHTLFMLFFSMLCEKDVNYSMRHSNWHPWPWQESKVQEFHPKNHSPSLFLLAMFQHLEAILWQFFSPFFPKEALFKKRHL